MVISRQAFTLIEMLVVVGIIVILAGLLLTTLGGTQDLAKKKQTETMLTGISVALATQAQQGSSAAPTEHPLAGSKTPRALFRYGSTNLETGTEGLVVKDRSWLTANTSAILDPDDRFAQTTGDGAALHLFGTPRRLLQILGPVRAEVTSYRRLPDVSSQWGQDSNSDGTRDSLRTPYTSATYPDFRFLMPQTSTSNDDLTSDSERSLRYALGSGYDDMVSLNAIQSHTGTNLLDGRVVAPSELPPSTPASHSDWLPCFVVADDSWQFYRLPGTNLYDAWGTEILVGRSKDGDLVLMSAGADRCFRVDPGSNGVIDSESDLATFAGDDLDGSKDNVVISGDVDSVTQTD